MTDHIPENIKAMAALAREENDPNLAITPGLWFKKGSPVMFGTLVVSTILFATFFDFFARPIN